MFKKLNGETVSEFTDSSKLHIQEVKKYTQLDFGGLPEARDFNQGIINLFETDYSGKKVIIRDYKGIGIVYVVSKDDFENYDDSELWDGEIECTVPYEKSI